MLFYQAGRWASRDQFFAPKSSENLILKRVVVKVWEGEAILHDAPDNIPVYSVSALHRRHLTFEGCQEA